MELNAIPAEKWDTPMLTTKQAARILRIDDSTIRYQIAHGKMAATKIGRDWAISPRAIVEYNNNHRRKKKCKP